MGLGATELKDILEKHKKWLRSEPGGERANLSSADLRSADLSYADLRSADLSSADLSYANLRYADLSYANLRYADLSSANLRYADLSYANLSSIKEDFFKRLSVAHAEVAGLYDYLMRGKIDGTSYSGECACFVGTIANIRKENYENLTISLKPDVDSATERWFMGILKGDTPQSNQVARITKEWLEEFAGANAIALPAYKIVSSAEYPLAFAEAP